VHVILFCHRCDKADVTSVVVVVAAAVVVVVVVAEKFKIEKLY